MGKRETTTDILNYRVLEAREENAKLRKAMRDLLGKLIVMSGCNEHDMEVGGNEEWPEFQRVRALLSKRCA